MRTVVPSLLTTLFLFAGLLLWLVVATGSATAGTLATLLAMGLRGFLRPAYGPAARGAPHPLPDLLTRMWDSAALLVAQLVRLVREPYRRTVVVHDTHGRLGPARPVTLGLIA